MEVSLLAKEGQLSLVIMALIILVSHALCRIDEIHQQLEEQLSVLSHFIDGVANLRPKGLSGVLVMALFV